MTATIRFPLAATGAALLVLAGCTGSTATVQPQADALVVGEGATVTATATGATSLLANDLNADGATIDTEPATAPTHGTVTLFADGTFSYVHDGGESTADGFTYVAVAGGQRAEASVVIEVDPEDDPPQVGADSYIGALGNTWLTAGLPVQGGKVEASGGLLDNDSDPDGTLVVTDFDATSVAGGTVYVASNGSFTYLPAPGFNGTDSFGYTVSDNHASASGTVTVQVAETIWWVDGGQPAGGNGTAQRPFASLDELAAAEDVGEGDVIYIYADADPYVGSIEMRPGQTLHGEGTAFELGGLSLPAGERPLIRNPEGDGVLLAPDVTLRGFNIGETRGPGIGAEMYDDPTPSPGTVTIRDVAIEGGGPAIFIFAPYVLDVELDSVASIGSGESENDPEFGMVVLMGSGRFVVKGETVIRSSQAVGMLLGYPFFAGDAPLGLGDGPPTEIFTSVDFDFQGPVSVIDSGWPEDPQSSGFAGAMWISLCSGDVQFQDVTIAQRNHAGIITALCPGRISFRDVDISNDDGAHGPAYLSVLPYGETTLASLDVADALDWDQGGSAPYFGAYPGAVQLMLEYGPLDAPPIADFAENPTVQDVVFRITGDGPQGDGGTISNSESFGLFVFGFGTLDLHGMAFTDNPTGVLIGGVVDRVNIDGCDFSKWGVENPEDEQAALAIHLDELGDFGDQLFAMQVYVTDCDFDGTGQWSDSPAVQVFTHDGAELMGQVYFGLPDEDGVAGGNRLTGLQNSGLAVETHQMGLLCEVVNNTFVSANETVAVGEYAISLDADGLKPNSILIEDNTATGKFGEFARFFGNGTIEATADGWLLAATIKDNVVTGAGGFARIEEETDHTWHIHCTGNTSTDLSDHAVIAELNGTQGVDELSMLRMAGNSYSFVNGYLGRDLGGSYGTPYYLLATSAGCYEFRSESFVNAASLPVSVPVVHLEASIGCDGLFEVTCIGTQFDGDNEDILVGLINYGSAGFDARVEGHTAGIVETRVASGRTMRIEQRGSFTTLNPGAVFRDGEEASSSAPAETVDLPEGPWR